MDAVSDQYPLYRPALERDACGIALVADALGRASHETVERGLLALNRLSHRGATGGGTHAIDGAGILTDIPWTLLEHEHSSSVAPGDRVRALATLFLPRAAVREAQQVIERVVRAAGWEPERWREVPVHGEVLAAVARASEPSIHHLVLSTPASAEQPDLSLLRIRVRLLHETVEAGLPGVAVASISRRTVVYKALVEPKDLPVYFPDLADARFVSAVALAHQRFSTNTLARWDLSQPFHFIAHNGEINTISGNRQWMRARQLDEAALPGWSREAGALIPTGGSDSESLDAAVGLLCANGLDLPLAMTRLVPPAWEKDPELTPDEIAFYECQAAVSEPWDGPASLAFSDGRISGVRLDRNGFRPARFMLTRDQQLLAGSETGLFDLDERDILKQGRLGPGQMVFVDREAHTIQHGREISRAQAHARPYRLWVRRLVRHFHEESLALSVHVGAHVDADRDRDQRELTVDQRLFGMDREEVELIIRSLAVEGKEAVGSMGDDTPPAALSQRPRLLSDFFRQRFAQVTNPPMDALREGSVMSLQVWLGPRGDITREDGGETQVLALDTPILTESGLARLYAQTEFPIVTLPLHFEASAGVDGLRPAVEALAQQAAWEVEQGASLLVLSDRDTTSERAPIPALLAVGAVHQCLIDRGCRLRASIIVETGEARDAHQVATLLANGASAVVPSLGLRMGRALHLDDPTAGEKKYRQALEEGLLKIFSKMGVSTLTGYCGAQLFEVLGLAPELARLFPASPCVSGTITFARVAKDVLERHRLAFETEHTVPLKHFGFHGFRRDGDYHAFNPEIVKRLHHAVGSNSAAAYDDFSTLVHGRAPMEVRDLLEFNRTDRQAVPIDEVESADRICRRFFASAMSVGALGPEAHRVIATAMNRMGARSNSGEGGEEPERFRPSHGEPDANSTTKQVASARFGVTPAYLISATELQIKMAQGSKPGEGGQLPATKVVDHIARLRHAQPGTSLISPPPHHDIYSIEDLAQLIFDLRSFHPTARMNVKLVSQVGVGIVAAGVVKCGATAIQLSGHSGGTGASPRGSIKHAGMPWEIGLAETQQVLTMNGLRHRVVLQADGGLKTGRDVAIAAALGAEEFGFGTAALVAIGCLMARQCHLNTCPVGIATQRPDLRAKFNGTPEQAIAYFGLVAEDVRRILASLGLHSVQELVGRTDLLQPRQDLGEPVIDLTPILAFRAQPSREATAATPPASAGVPIGELNDQLVAALSGRLGREPLDFESEIRNTDRTVGARLSGIAAAMFGDAGLPHPLKLRFTGSAGQSLGAFLVPGMSISVKGDANDFVGKGMHGGEIVLAPPPGVTRRRDRVLAGNSVLYGATGGRLFIAGRAGERFAVRNSGATAVVEGVGEHGCEYMTGGTVVVLGDIGRNFAAGMTGGRAYVYDPTDALDTRCNSELVDVMAIDDDDWEELHQLIVAHRRATGSLIARAILSNWSKTFRDFRLVLPRAAEEIKLPGVRTAHARA